MEQWFSSLSMLRSDTAFFFPMLLLASYSLHTLFPRLLFRTLLIDGSTRPLFAQ